MTEVSTGAGLLPCPCCGSGLARQPGRYTQASFSGVEVMDAIYEPYVWCGTCCLQSRKCDSVAEAIAAWNQRATPEPAGELVERVARALCQSALGGKLCPCIESGKFACADSHPGQQARAAIAAMPDRAAIKDIQP